MTPSAPLAPNARIHCVGIGGFGINPIARVMHQLGYTISGCDRNESPLVAPLREMGISIEIGHDAAHLDTFTPDALLISSAVMPDCPEVVEAARRGIPVYKRSDILGQLMQDRVGVAVAGTHGKTTTTSMIAWTLDACGLDPTFIIGGVSKDLGTNARAGKGSAFVIEADEYDRMFMGLKPKIAVLTSLEMDHPDMFNNLDEVRALFIEFVDLLPDDGLLIGCVDDEEVYALIRRRIGQGRPTLGYGLTGGLWHARGVKTSAKGGAQFEVVHTTGVGPKGPSDERNLVTLTLPGQHNVQNALAALAVADQLGLDTDKAIEALGRFTGTGRRFEVKGEVGGVTVIDDYAHHPTAIKATLEAARSRYPDRAIWAVWQPHTYRRTKALLDEFAASFGSADHVIITDVYQSRDAHDYGVSVQDVLDRMSHPDARHIGAQGDVTNYLAKNVKSGDVVIVMSAGDATKIGDDLLRQL